MQRVSHILCFIAAMAMLAPVDTRVEMAKAPCQMNAVSGCCCCSMDAGSPDAATESACCCDAENDKPAEPTSLPDREEGCCTSGQCTCHVSLCCGNAMPFLAPIIQSGTQAVLVNNLPVPDLSVSGDACLQGVFHPPRC